MEEKISMLLRIFIGYLKSENLGFAIFKDGSFVFIDQGTNEQWRITPENLQRLYDDYEAIVNAD